MKTTIASFAIAEKQPMLNWWDTSSVEECRRSFRTALKASRFDCVEIRRSWITYVLTAILRGTPRAAVIILPALLDRFGKSGAPFWSTGNAAEDAIAAKTLFRSVMVLAEYPDVPLHSVWQVASAAQAACNCYSGVDSGPAVRVALAPRLGTLRQAAGDCDGLEKAWEENRTEDPPLCRAATGEIITEFLVAAGETDRAIAFAASAVNETPCIAPCFLAPQGMLAGLLEPLHVRGMPERARAWHARLVASASVSRMWLRHAGARASYLALTGDHRGAAGLRRRCAPWADDPDASAWQRLHYHRAAARSLALAEQAGAAKFADPQRRKWHDQEARLLELAFSTRNAAPADAPFQ